MRQQAFKLLIHPYDSMAEDPMAASFARAAFPSPRGALDSVLDEMRRDMRRDWSEIRSEMGREIGREIY